MRFRNLLLLVCPILFLSSSMLSGQTRATNRLATIEEGKRTSLQGNVEPRARKAADAGGLDGAQQIEFMTLRFNLTPAQDAALAQLLQDQQNPTSPRYHQWLTPEQYGEQFGLSSADLQRVSSWLTNHGLTVTDIPRSRTYIGFSGTVSQVQTAFHTSMHRLQWNGETHFANVTDPELPSALTAVVTSITGLNDFKLQPRVQPRFTSSTSGSHYIAPGDIYTIYNVNPLLTRKVNGSGVTIAVMGQTDISLSSVATFRSVSGLSVNPPTVKLYGTDPGTVSADLGEAMLDVEWSGAAAPSASILYVNSTAVVDKSLTGAINDNLAPIITISYGLCEAGWGQASLNTFNQLFRQANAQGITIVGPTGDSGATDCDYNGDGTVKSATGGLAIDFPASSPFVTALGGTMFNEGSGSYWSSTNGTNQGSALSYIPEAVWNEYTVTRGISGGGGGRSKFFAKPAWQQGTGVPADFARDIPDVSLNAAASHDGYLICYNAYCTNGYRDSNGSLAVIGGTSVSTPIFAGFLALVEQSVGSRLGNVNPTLYALANNALATSVFHDVTVGDNKNPCTVGSTDCPSGTTSIGYSAGTGYDLATGWGSVDANALVTSWNAVTPLSSGGTVPSNTTITLSATSLTSGTAITVNATVASASSSSTATPSGSGQVLIDGAPTGVSATFSSGKATFNVATGSLKSGDHTVAIAYTGDTVFGGSVGSAVIDVVSATDPDFSLSPVSATMTANAGSNTSPLTLTLKSMNGFTGTVNFTIATTSSNLAAQYQFAPQSVTLAANGTATATLTLSAYQQSSTSTNGLTQFGEQQARNRSLMPLLGGSAAFACLLCMGMPRRRRLGGLLAVLATVGVLGAIGCGGGGSSSTSSTGGTITRTTPGSYAITVTATSASGSSTVTHHRTQITFTVN